MSKTCVYCDTIVSEKDKAWPFCPHCLEEAIEDYAKSTPIPPPGRLFLSRFFSWVFERHIANRHNADYEVCRHPLCRLAYFAERWIWYRGTA